ncbi:MAG: hypothetical protein ACI9EW_002123 [Cellvibrionaceae bacterium]|jgi:hypothetical protein
MNRDDPRTGFIIYGWLTFLSIMFVTMVLFATIGEMSLELNRGGLVLQSKIIVAPKNEWQTTLFALVGLSTLGYWSWFWSRYFLPLPPKF